MSKKNKSTKVGRRKKPTKTDMRSNRVSRELEKRRQLLRHRRHQDYMRMALDNQITMQTTMDLDVLRQQGQFLQDMYSQIDEDTKAYHERALAAVEIPMPIKPDAIMADGTIMDLKLASDMPKPIIVAEESGRQLGKMLKLAEQTNTGGFKLNIGLPK